MTLGRKQPQSMRPTLAVRIRLWLSAGKQVDGIWIGAYSARDFSSALSRVEQALRLIKQHDRPRYNQIARDLDRVWVRLLPLGIGHFDYSLRACLLDERFVLAETTEPEFIAAAIVHEAAHARLWRCGIGYDEATRTRVESICIRRELAFASKLPNGEDVRDWAKSALDRPLDLMDSDFKEPLISRA